MQLYSHQIRLAYHDGWVKVTNLEFYVAPADCSNVSWSRRLPSDVHLFEVRVTRAVSSSWEDVSSRKPKLAFLLGNFRKSEQFWIEISYMTRVKEGKFVFPRMVVPKCRRSRCRRLRCFLGMADPPMHTIVMLNLNQHGDQRGVDPVLTMHTPWLVPRPRIMTPYNVACNFSMEGCSVSGFPGPTAHHMELTAHPLFGSVALRVSVRRPHLAGVSCRAQWQLTPSMVSMPRLATCSGNGCVEFFWIVSTATMAEVRAASVVCEVMAGDQVVGAPLCGRDVRVVRMFNLHAIAAELLGEEDRAKIARAADMYIPGATADTEVVGLVEVAEET